ncbi:MAG TPA: ribosome-associated translation inhibitor RaiA [Opitutaceae bacterium]
MPNKNNHAPNGHEIILAGIHMDLTDALKNIAHEKLERLFRHEDRIVRVRVELEFDKTRGHEHEFIAKGHVQIYGPDMICSVASEDCLKSLDLLVDKLDRMIRRRARMQKVKRHHPHAVEIPAAIPKV